MSAVHTPATAVIQRKLDRWELQHLRLLAKQQAEQIDELQRRAEWAEDCAERWRDDALELQREEADASGGLPGLTQTGRLVVVAPPAPTATQAPSIGQPWPGIEGSLYAGIAAGDGDTPDGHLVLLPDEPDAPLVWQDALAWAEALGDGAHVPTRTESALLYAHLRDQLNRSDWHWTSTPYEVDGSSAWIQRFNRGSQFDYHKSYEARCRAVRRFPLQSFDPSGQAA